MFGFSAFHDKLQLLVLLLLSPDHAVVSYPPNPFDSLGARWISGEYYIPHHSLSITNI